MQWLNFKPKGEAMSEIHKGRQEALASLCKVHRRKQNKTSDLGKAQWTLQGFTRPHLNLDLIWQCHQENTTYKETRR